MWRKQALLPSACRDLLKQCQQTKMFFIRGYTRTNREHCPREKPKSGRGVGGSSADLRGFFVVNFHLLRRQTPSSLCISDECNWMPRGKFCMIRSDFFSMKHSPELVYRHSSMKQFKGSLFTTFSASSLCFENPADPGHRFHPSIQEPIKG